MLAALTAAVLWGTTGATQELGASEAAPLTVAAARNLLGGVGLVILVVATGRRDQLRSVMRSAPVPATIASVAMAVFAVGYLTAVRQVGVGIGTLATIGGAPVWAGLLGAAFGRRPHPRWWISTATTVAGAAVLLAPGAEVGTGAGSAVAGVLSGLVAGAAYAVYTTAAKRVLEAGVHGNTTMAVTFAASGLLLTPLLATGDLGWLRTGAGLATVGWLGLVTIVIGYVFFARGLRSLDAPTVTTLTLAEPLTAAVLGVVVIGERPTVAGAVGGALLAVGLVLVGARPRRGSSRPAGSPGRRGGRSG